MASLTFSKDTVLSEQRLQEFEKTLKRSLPADYRSFLLEHNGGKPTPSTFEIPACGDEAALDILYGVDRPNDIAKWIAELKGDIPDSFIPVGCDPGGNVLLMALTEDHCGAIYYWDSVRHFVRSKDQENTYLVAATFSDFLEKLY